MSDQDLIPCLKDGKKVAFLCADCVPKAAADGQKIHGVPRATVRKAMNAREEWKANCGLCKADIPLVTFAQPTPEGTNPFENLTDYDDPDGFMRDGHQVFTLLPTVTGIEDGHPIKVNGTIWLVHHTVKIADSVLVYCLPPIMWHDQPKATHVVEASEQGQLIVCRVNAPAGMPCNTADVEANAIRMYAQALDLNPEDPGYPSHVFFFYHTLHPGDDVKKEVLSFRQEVYQRMGLGRYPDGLVPVEIHAGRTEDEPWLSI